MSRKNPFKNKTPILDDVSVIAESTSDGLPPIQLSEIENTEFEFKDKAGNARSFVFDSVRKIYPATLSPKERLGKTYLSWFHAYFKFNSEDAALLVRVIAHQAQRCNITGFNQLNSVTGRFTSYLIENNVKLSEMSFEHYNRMVRVIFGNLSKRTAETYLFSFRTLLAKIPSIPLDARKSISVTRRMPITSVDWHPNGATHLRANGATLNCHFTPQTR